MQIKPPEQATPRPVRSKLMSRILTIQSSLNPESEIVATCQSCHPLLRITPLIIGDMDFNFLTALNIPTDFSG